MKFRIGHTGVPFIFFFCTIISYKNAEIGGKFMGVLIPAFFFIGEEGD